MIWINESGKAFQHGLFSINLRSLRNLPVHGPPQFPINQSIMRWNVCLRIFIYRSWMVQKKAQIMFFLVWEVALLSSIGKFMLVQEAGFGLHFVRKTCFTAFWVISVGDSYAFERRVNNAVWSSSPSPGKPISFH